MDTSKSDSDQTIPLPTPIKANAMLAKDFFAKLSYEVSNQTGGIFNHSRFNGANSR
jgi:hypothetical protein